MSRCGGIPPRALSTDVSMRRDPSPGTLDECLDAEGSLPGHSRRMSRCGGIPPRALSTNVSSPLSAARAAQVLDLRAGTARMPKCLHFGIFGKCCRGARLECKAWGASGVRRTSKRSPQCWESALGKVSCVPCEPRALQSVGFTGRSTEKRPCSPVKPVETVETIFAAGLPPPPRTAVAPAILARRAQACTSVSLGPCDESGAPHPPNVNGTGDPGTRGHTARSASSRVVWYSKTTIPPAPPPPPHNIRKMQKRTSFFFTICRNFQKKEKKIVGECGPAPRFVSEKFFEKKRKWVLFEKPTKNGSFLKSPYSPLSAARAQAHTPL